MQLSKNFSLSEFTNSFTSIKYNISNKPNSVQIDRISYFVKNVLQPFRNYCKLPIVITSGFRSPALNSLVGGSSNSYHLLGTAADIKIKGFSSYQLEALFRMYLLSVGSPASSYEIISYPASAGGHLHIALKK